jgi:hypothetical protein
MFSIRRRFFALGIAALLALPFLAATPALAASDRYISIQSLPYTISLPGCYRLVANLSCTLLGSGAAITINCDNVVLDLEGHSIVYVGSGGATGPVPAITASNRTNIKIRNGTLRGFWQGVVLTAAPNLPGIVVEDLTVVESRQSAIILDGFDGALVRRCNVARTRYLSAYGSGDTFGIRVVGKNAVVHDNVVTTTTTNLGTATACAIDVATCTGAVVERNTIANDNFPYTYENTVGISAGWLNVVAGNRVTHMETGITYAMNAPGPYRDNIAVQCGTSYVGGIDAGNNY